MATNYIRDGKTTEFVAPVGGVTSGVPIVIQQTVCLPITTALVGVTFSAYTSGVWEMPKLGATTATAGARAYWDQVAGVVETTDAADNYLIGYFAEAATNGPLTCRVNVLAAVAADANLDVSAKANKVVPAAPGNLAGLTAGGDLQDSGVAAAAATQIVTEVAAAAAGGPWVMVSTGANRVIDDSAIDAGTVPTMAGAAAGAGLIIVSGGANRTQAAAATPITADPQGRAMVADDFFTTAEMVAGAGGKFTPGAFDTTALANVVADDAFTAAQFAAGAGGKFAPNCLDQPNLANLIADDAFTAAEFAAGAGGKFAPNALVAAGVDNLVALDAIGEDRLTAQEASQRLVTDSAVYNANAAVLATAVGMMGCFVFSKEAADAVDIVLTLPANFDIRVLDAWAVKTAGNGAAGDTVQLFNGGAAISDIMVLNVVDTTVVRVATINDANHRVAGGGTLTADFTLGAGGNTQSQVYVSFLRVA